MTLLDRIVRRFRIAYWNSRGKKFYVCHLAHPNDRISAANLAAYFKRAGIKLEVIAFNSSGQRPELLPALGEDTLAVIGYNSQLDHSWVGDEKFVALAEKRNIPVVQCILDHPSLRWPVFEHNLDARNVRYALVSRYCEEYFRRYCVKDARTAVVGCKINPMSRVEDFSRESFLARDFTCLIPLNLRRIGGTGEELEARIGELEPRMADAVREAIERARFDLDGSLTPHLERSLASRQIELPDNLMHLCAGLVEDMTQVWRRRRIFEVAARFPVLIQTDWPPPELTEGAVATFKTTPEWTEPGATLTRMKSCRSVVSVSLTNDLLHDRTANAINAGCVAIVEDNLAHRRLFKPDETALFFRYDDDSLERGLDLVCNSPERAYEIARRGIALRENRAFGVTEFDNLIEFARP
jgi:hypothetical protein